MELDIEMPIGDETSVWKGMELYWFLRNWCFSLKWGTIKKICEEHKSFNLLIDNTYILLCIFFLLFISNFESTFFH